MARYSTKSVSDSIPEKAEKPEVRRGRPPIGANTEKIRNKRLPIFDPGDRLSFPRNPAFHRIWVTDVKNQLQDHLDSGFSYVTRRMVLEEEGRIGEGDSRQDTDMDTRISRNVGRAHVHDNAIAYLLQIPMDEWQEIRKMISEERQRPMKEIKGQIESMKRQGYYGDMKQEVEHLR